MRTDKILLFSSLTNIKKYLLGKNIYTDIDSCCDIYTDKIAINFFSEDEFNFIRIWKTKVLFNLWYDNFNCRQLIAALNYEITKDYIKIDYLNINDGDGYSESNFVLNLNESETIKKALLQFIKNLAIKEKKKKIIIDVHENLRIFNKYYKNEGFVTTTHRCHDNRFWIEAELNI